MEEGKIRNSNNNKKKNRFLSKIITLLLAFTIIFTSSVHTFAGTSSSNAGKNPTGGLKGDTYVTIGHGTGKSNGFRWHYNNDGGELKVKNPGTGASNYSGYSVYAANTSKYAYVEKHSGGHGWHFCNWAWWFGFCRGDTPGSNAWMYNDWNGGIWNDGNAGGKLNNADLVQEAKNNSFYYNKDDQLYRNSSDNRALDAVWIEGWTSSTTNTIYTITKVQYSDDDSDIVYDKTNESAETLYNNPTGEYIYSGRSKEDEMNHKKVIWALITPVTMTHTYTTDGSTTWGDTYSYSKGESKWLGKNVKYDVRTEDLEQKVFKPYDLNVNGPVNNESELKKDYPNYVEGSDPLDMFVNNNQNIIDGSFIQTLDTNTSTKFNITFNNDQFGIPKASEGGFDIAIEAPGKEYRKDSGAYELGVFDKYGSEKSGSTGKIYTEIVQNTSGTSENDVNGKYTSDLYWGGGLNAGIDSGASSISYNNSEKTGGSSSFNFDRGFLGGDFTFKTTKTGNYYLYSNGRKYWEASYEQGKFYTYGVAYEGKITTSNIEEPTITEDQLYAKLKSASIVQPVVKGKFKAKTVAGNIG